MLSTIKNISKCEISEKNQDDGPFSLGKYYCLTIEGNGFLKQMVRLVMGSIWEVGRGKLSLEDLNAAICQKEPLRVGPVAPASGLYMVKVFY